MSIQDTVVRVRAQYGPTPTVDECGAIVNEVAWIHRADLERWGVSGKASGNHAVRSDGVAIATDILQSAVSMEIFDVLIASGPDENGKLGPATPTWQPKGILIHPDRPWIAPIAPTTAPPQPPDPHDPPTSLACVFQPCTHTEVMDALADIHERLVAIESKLATSTPHDPPWVLKAKLDLWGSKRDITGVVGGAGQ